MFTGIVEEKGTIEKIVHVSDEALELVIIAETVLVDVRLGDSIAINGICLTVTSFTDTTFSVDVMPETIKATSLRSITEGSVVNLERALLPTDRLGGHFVTGHVDGIGTIVKKRSEQNAVYYDIEIDEDLLTYFIMKGSVAVDGVSLTIFGVDPGKRTFTISLIPHTMEVTNLGKKTIGDIVNIECDMLAKHVQHYLQQMSLLDGKKEG